MRRALADWLDTLGLVSAGAVASFDRYIGYYEPYASSHEALDRDEAVQEEVRNAARALVKTMTALRDQTLVPASDGLTDPRPKLPAA